MNMDVQISHLWNNNLSNAHNCHIIIIIKLLIYIYIYTCIYNPHLCYMKVFFVE